MIKLFDKKDFDLNFLIVPQLSAFSISLFPSSEGPHRLSVLVFKELLKRLVLFVVVVRDNGNAL